MKSMVPAIVVRRCSVGKRVIRLIPDLPATSAGQFSSMPMPSEETTPMPVIATTGRPRESLTFEAITTSMFRTTSRKPRDAERHGRHQGQHHDLNQHHHPVDRGRACRYATWKIFPTWSPLRLCWSLPALIS